jgi:hypothetical protein
LPSQFEGSHRTYQHGCALSAGMRRRKKKYSFHESFVPAKAAVEANK